MTDSHAPFPKPVQKEALERQRRRCASCRTVITELGRSGAQRHVFGEGVEAHLVIPHKLGGPIYNDLKNLTMPAKIARIAALYPHYRG
jgi:hypothetical protein